MRNNIISNCEYSFEFWERNNTAFAHDIYFENNTCVNAGGGWGHNQRPDGANGRHLMIYTNTATTNNVYIRNNIFPNGTESIIWVSNIADISDVTIDYNDLYQSSGYIGRIACNNYNTLANWRTASSQNAHSISGNPIFVSAIDFHLQAASPAIGAGIDVGLTTDYDGNTSKDPPSIGAYDYDSKPTSPVIIIYPNPAHDFINISIEDPTLAQL